jgi:hypothetical protein
VSAIPPAGPRGIFISYRRDDVAGDARVLRNALRERFGVDAVYFDVDQQPGTDWEARLRERGKQADVFLAVIGPRWLSELKVRLAAAQSSGAIDFVRREIEWALSDEWPGVVIPVLINTAMPKEQELPLSIQALHRPQAVSIRHETFDEDVEQLVETLAEMTFPPVQSIEEAGEAVQAIQTAPPAHEPARAAAVPAPPEQHYREVIDEMTRGMVVPWLGASVRGALPDSRFLAEKLAEEFPDLHLVSTDLAEIAQTIAMMRGATRLQDKLRELIGLHSEPINVHTFLASLPRLLRQRGSRLPYPMIISTNYDRALERAFKEANEPFDYAVYTPKTGRFTHVPWGEGDDRPKPIAINDPANYFGFPMIDNYQLARTVIVQLHGGPTVWDGGPQSSSEILVTEDQYIDYLPTDAIEGYLPRQILDKLKGSRCLFLGYALRAWSARVLLRRIWPGTQLSEDSWAIEDEPDDLEKRIWTKFGVELLDAHPAEYADTLEKALEPTAVGAV